MTNDTTKTRELTEDHRPLADSELDAVAGGFPLYDPAELRPLPHHYAIGRIEARFPSI